MIFTCVKCSHEHKNIALGAKPGKCPDCASQLVFKVLKEKKMNYYVHYTEDCAPSLKSFKNPKDRDAWLVKWFLKHQLEMDGYWIDLIFEGEITFKDEGITIA